MEYVQERVTTLHALRDRTPEAPTDRAAVVVPMTEREYGGLAAERVLSELAAVDPARVIVPLRSSPERAGTFHDWLAEFDVDVETLWCDGPRLEALLDDNGLAGERGKGRDVWLGLGQALAEDYVVVHDADTKSYSSAYVPKLLSPLAHGHEFAKGYYARVEADQLYGRLFRLLFRPLVRALAEETNAPVVDYLESFRYALAGEFAATSDVVAGLQVQRSWGLEVGTLGDAFRQAGFEGSAQVDLGRYEHDHRSVRGPTGLADMSRYVTDATLRAVADNGVDPEFETLPDRYREAARSLVDAYRVDAEFNGLDFDRDDERDQVETYAEAMTPLSTEDTRLPPWSETALDPEAVVEACRADLAAVRAE